MAATDLQDGDLLGSEPPRLLALAPYWRLSRRLKLALAALTVAVVAVAAYLGATHYPDTSAPQGSELGRRIFAAFGLPRTGADNSIVGDYLVERFYAIDVQTGEHYVADVLKGRITGVQASDLNSDNPSYTLLLDLQNLQRDRAFYAAYIQEVAPPEGADVGEYLGLRVLPGLTDAFAVNYTGHLAERHQAFRGPSDDDAYSFLLQQHLTDLTDEGPQLESVGDFNYLLNSTGRFTFFREFGIQSAVFLSELVIVDGTGRPQMATYYRLVEQYLHTAH